MPYNYQEQRETVFTDEGQRRFLKVRDSVDKMLKHSGAARSGEIIHEVCGDLWELLACIDRLVELGEIREIPQGRPCASQCRIFVRAYNQS